MNNELYETIGFIIYSTIYHLDEEEKKKDKKLNKKILKNIIKQLFKDNNLNASKIGKLTEEIQQLKEENTTLKEENKVKKRRIEHQQLILSKYFDKLKIKFDIKLKKSCIKH